jgi:predicted permease
MFASALSQDAVLLGILLAIFTIGLQYIPIEFFFRFFKHRNPTKEEILMVRKILGIIAVIAFVLLCFWILKTVVDLAFYIADLFVTIGSIGLLQRNLIATEGIVLGFSFITYCALLAWRNSKRLKIEKTETENLTDSTNSMNGKLDLMAETNSELVEINKQILLELKRITYKGDNNVQKEE